jgi:hypothetical protein
MTPGRGRSGALVFSARRLALGDIPWRKTDHLSGRCSKLAWALVAASRARMPGATCCISELECQQELVGIAHQPHRATPRDASIEG